MAEEEKKENLLQAASNVIELKPDHKYLLVFKGDYTPEQIEPLLFELERLGIQGIGLALSNEDELDVIEVPKEKFPVVCVEPDIKNLADKVEQEISKRWRMAGRISYGGRGMPQATLEDD